jgi:hypothetical protein
MRLLVLLLVLLPTLLTAQHCGHDFTSIIVVRPHRLNNATVEPDLRITLLDTNNLPAVINGEDWNRFRPNDGGSKLPDRTWQPHFERHRGDIYPFAKDNYVLVIPSHINFTGYSILVQDERNGGMGELRRTVVPITNNDVYSLCGTFNDDAYPPIHGRPNFAPVDIILYPR